MNPNLKPVREFELKDINFTLDEMIQILEHHQPETVPYYTPYKLTWCINSDAVRCVILEIGKARYVVYNKAAEGEEESFDELLAKHGELLDDLHLKDGKATFKGLLHAVMLANIDKMLRR